MNESLLLVLIDSAFVAHVILSAPRLPERIATHFAFNGQADGWLSRRAYLAILLFMGPGLSLVWLAIEIATRNTPRHSLALHIMWAGCLLLVFMFGIHLLTVAANRRTPAQLPMRWFWGLLASLQLGLVVWALTFPQ